MGKAQRNVLAAAAIVATVAACAREEVGEARFGADACRRIALINEDGEMVRGAEDLAVDKANGRLFISAYDRRAVEKAAKRKRAAPPNGGVYAIDLGTLFDQGTDQIRVSSLAAPGDITGGLRPHGLSYDAVNDELIFINRTYVRHGRRWRMTPRLQRIGANGEVFVGQAVAAPCAANDVVTVDERVITTFDHASCGFGGGVEDIFRLKRSGLSDEKSVVFDKAAFANGVARLNNGEVVIAATRENALLVMNERQDGVKDRIKLPGGPDNITVADDGWVIAAVHPKMMKLAFNRKLGWGRAPSRIVKANVETGAAQILFNDPNGELFSAATVAVETPRGLVAGSVTDDGLLVCRATP